MLFWLIPLVLGILQLGAFLYFRVRERRVIAVIFKGLVSLMFIITALVALLTSKNPQSSFGLYVIIGLFFGLLGDVFLDLKFIILEKESLYTILGFISFGIGHIFYLTGLFTNYYSFDSSILYLIIPIIIALVFVTGSLLMEKFTPIRYKKMTPFVIGYGFILFFTTSIYMSTVIQNGWQSPPLIIVAFSLIVFAISDLILNNTYFAPNCGTPLFIISNHVCYYIAQFAIAISLFYLV